VDRESTFFLTFMFLHRCNCELDIKLGYEISYSN